MAVSQVLEIPQDIFDSARLTPAELKVEMAIHLYAEGRLSIGKARELANLTLWEFRQLLASRRIPPHYDTEDLADDVRSLRALGRTGPRRRVRERLASRRRCSSGTILVARR